MKKEMIFVYAWILALIFIGGQLAAYALGNVEAENALTALAWIAIGVMAFVALLMRK